MEKPNKNPNEKYETQEQEKPAYKKELEQNPWPEENEGLDKWIKRIGGPNVKVFDDLSKYSKPKKKEERLIVINEQGNFILNEKNFLDYFSKKDKEAADKMIEKDDADIKFNKNKKQYNIDKNLFKNNPSFYMGFIVKTLRNEKHIFADKNFSDNVLEWYKEQEEQKEQEKQERGKEQKEKPKQEEKKKSSYAKAAEDKKEKPLTLDERIKQKEEEFKKVELNHRIYYSPALKSLNGLYYDKRLKDLKKELKELKKQGKKKGGEKKTEKPPKGFPEEMPKRPKPKDYFKHLKNTENLHNEMIRTRWAVKKGKAKPEEYESIKKQWREAYNKTIEMENQFDDKTLDKIIKKRAKQRANKKETNLLKNKWNGFWNLMVKKFGKDTIRQVDKDAIKEQLAAIDRSLKDMPEHIRESEVMERAELEKEQRQLEKEKKRLENLLKKYKKQKAKKKE